MKIRSYLIIIALCIYGTTAGVVRKAPAFATPIYSDSYLPATLQVIFNIVGQLKRIEIEESEQNLLSTSATSLHPPGQKQPLPTTPSTSNIGIENDDIESVSVINDEEKYYISPEKYQEEALIISKPENKDLEKITSSNGDSNHEEISEIVYGVPEKNYEHQEPNDELPEEIHAVNSTANNHDQIKNSCNDYQTISDIVPSSKTTTSNVQVDSIVKEIYSIINKTTLNDDKKSEDSSSSSSSSITTNKECIESKNSPVNILADEKLFENTERADELKDDKRYTLLGERIDQVPRPSLIAFLRASNTTKNPSLRQLSDLYDALSRDARAQGFSQYAGYSEKLLKSLEETSGGGAGIQLKILLEKDLENKELRRYDAMEKTKEIIAVLKDESSKLSTDLRRILPLKFIA